MIVGALTMQRRNLPHFQFAADRWDVALKIEADRIGSFNNTSGLFNLPTATTQLKTVYLYSLGMTAAF